jgi:Effector Associated Constant Component 1
MGNWRIEARITPHSSRFTEGSESWLEPIVVALGGAHFFQSLARAFQAWIRYRPGDRSLTVTADIDGMKITVHVTASNVPGDALGPVMQALGEALK